MSPSLGGNLIFSLAAIKIQCSQVILIVLKYILLFIYPAWCAFCVHICGLTEGFLENSKLLLLQILLLRSSFCFL